MSQECEDTVEYFREQYNRGQSEVSRRVERRVFGEDVGGNGYTTVAEARRLSGVLRLAEDSLLLDLGAGRGWPGTYLARASGCRFVISDLPVEPLRQAVRYAGARRVTDRMSAVRADGTALPFASHSFDAVVHADVLC